MQKALRFLAASATVALTLGLYADAQLPPAPPPPRQEVIVYQTRPGPEAIWGLARRRVVVVKEKVKVKKVPRGKAKGHHRP